MKRKTNNPKAYLIVDSVGSIFVGDPGDDSRVALLTDKGQGALVGSEARELIGLRARGVGCPVTEAAYACRDQLTVACSSNSCVDLHALKYYIKSQVSNRLTMS